MRKDDHSEKPPPKNPKKNKGTVVIDTSQTYGTMEQVCAYFHRTPATINRWIKEKGFPPGRHGPLPQSWTDKHGNRITPQRPNDKALWLWSEVLAWAETNLIPRTVDDKPLDLRKPADRRVFDKLLLE